MRAKKTLAMAFMALVVFCASPSYGKGKQEDLLAGVRAIANGAVPVEVQQAQDSLNAADALSSALGTLFGGGKKRPKNLVTWAQKDPTKDVLVLMPFRDIRERTGQVIRNFDRRGRLVSEFYYVRTDNLAPKAMSDVHVQFVNYSRWIIKDMLMSRDAHQLVNSWFNNGVDKRTLIRMGVEWAAQQALFADVKDFSLKRKILVQGRDGSVSNTELQFEMNCFVVDLQSGTTKIAQNIKMSRENLDVDWAVLGGSAGAGYIERLQQAAITEAALQAAQVMSLAKEDPSRIIDANILDQIRGDVLNQKPNEVLYKGIGADGLMGDLVEVGERTWTLRFSDLRGVKPKAEFEIWTATKLGLPDAPTGVKVVVDFIAGQGLVGAHVASIDPRTAGVLPAPAQAPSGAAVVPRTEFDRPPDAGPVEPGVSFSQEFARALPGDLLPLSQGEEPEGFSAFVALAPEFVPAKGEKKATWLKRGKVVLIANPASSKDQPIKGLVGDSGYQGNPEAWVVWVLGSTDAANTASQHVAWDGWRLYPYDPSEKGR